MKKIRTGRPPVKNPKNVEIKIRISEKENKMLEYCMKKTEKNKSQVLRKALKRFYYKLSDKE